MTETQVSDAAVGLSAGRRVLAVIAWLWVLVPFLYGVWQLLIKVVPLFSR